MTVTFSSVVTRADGEIISEEIIDPLTTRSEFSEDKEDEVVTLKFGFYKNGSLKGQCYKSDLGNFSLEEGTYDVYAVANMPEDFVFDATVSALSSHSVTLASYSAMNNTGMPMAGILPRWSTTVDGVVRLNRLFDKVILDWTNEGNSFQPTDMYITEFSNVNQNTVVYPFGESYIPYSGSGNSSVDSYSGVSVTSYDSQYVLYLPENYLSSSSSERKKPDKSKKHSLIHASYSYKIGGEKISYNGDLAPYYIKAPGDTLWYQVYRNMKLTIKPLADKYPRITVTPWSDSIYVAQRHSFSITLTNVNSESLPVSVVGTEGLSVDTEPTKVYDSANKTLTLSGQYSCRKYIADATNKLKVMVGSLEQGSGSVTTLAPVLKFEEDDGYTLSNTSRTADYTINYHRVANDRSGAILDKDDDFASDLYSELLDYGQPTVTETKIQNTVKVEGTYGNFYLSQDITSATAGTYQNAVSVTPPSDCGVASAMNKVVLDLPLPSIYHWEFDTSELYVAQKRDFTITLSNSDGSNLSLDYDDTMLEVDYTISASDGTCTISGSYGCLKAGSASISVLYNEETLDNGSQSLTILAPTLKFNASSYTLSNNDRSESYTVSYAEGARGTFFDATLYDQLLKPTTSLSSEVENLVTLSSSSISLLQDITNATAGTYSNALIANPASVSCGVTTKYAVIYLQAPEVFPIVDYVDTESYILTESEPSSSSGKVFLAFRAQSQFIGQDISFQYKCTIKEVWNGNSEVVFEGSSGGFKYNFSNSDDFLLDNPGGFDFNSNHIGAYYVITISITVEGSYGTSYTYTACSDTRIDVTEFAY